MTGGDVCVRLGEAGGLKRLFSSLSCIWFEVLWKLKRDGDFCGLWRICGIMGMSNSFQIVLLCGVYLARYDTADESSRQPLMRFGMD